MIPEVENADTVTGIWLTTITLARAAATNVKITVAINTKNAITKLHRAKIFTISFVPQPRVFRIPISLF